MARVALYAAGDDQQKAAPLGLFVLLLLGVACYFLFKSMSRHLKRVREEFPIGSSVRTTPTSPPTATRSTVPGSASTARPIGAGPGPVIREPDGAEDADGEEPLRPH